MVAPDVVSGGETETEAESDDGPTEASDEDVQMAVATVDDVGDPDGYFDGVETETQGSSGSDSSSPFDDVEDSTSESSSNNSGGPGGSSSPSSIGDIASRGGPLAQNINNGFARAAVIGIENQQEKDSLYQEFQETFATFQLGYYGEQVVHEYLDPDMEDIHPVAGLVGAALLCTAVVIYKRPDSDDLIETARDFVPFGGDSADEEEDFEFSFEDYRPPERPETDGEDAESGPSAESNDANADADTEADA